MSYDGWKLAEPTFIEATEEEEPCVLCQVQDAMVKVMDILEALPETGKPIYDMPVVVAFNAADTAWQLLKHDCDCDEVRS